MGYMSESFTEANNQKVRYMPDKMSKEFRPTMSDLLLQILEAMKPRFCRIDLFGLIYVKQRH